jgi:hypothetical protein
MSGNAALTPPGMIECVADGFNMPGYARAALGIAPRADDPVPVAPPPKASARQAQARLALAGPAMLDGRLGFSAELRRLAEAHGWSGNELARRVPCNRAYISRLVNGKQMPSVWIAARLDEELGASGVLIASASLLRRLEDACS